MGPDSSLPRVLIVDDDETDRLLARRALLRIGVRNPVDDFPTGTEAIEHLTGVIADQGEDGRVPVCAVLLDLRMPHPDGFEVLQWIRAQRALSHIQVVVLTGSVDPKDMRRAAELRADLYLPKFPSDETLARVISKASASTLQAMRVANLR